MKIYSLKYGLAAMDVDDGLCRKMFELAVQKRIFQASKEDWQMDMLLVTSASTIYTTITSNVCNWKMFLKVCYRIDRTSQLLFRLRICIKKDHYISQ